MQVNIEFRSNMYRNRVPVLTSKSQKETDTKKVQGKVRMIDATQSKQQ